MKYVHGLLENPVLLPAVNDESNIIACYFDARRTGHT